MKNWSILGLSLFFFAVGIEEIVSGGSTNIIDVPRDFSEFVIIMAFVISILGFVYLWKKNFFQRDN